MGRLIVDVVSRESVSSDAVGHLGLFVSVSRSDTGLPVTGLGIRNFRLCGGFGVVEDYQLHGASEVNWEPRDEEPAGCYRLTVSRSPAMQWTPGEYYSFGLQVIVVGGEGAVVDAGQSAVRVKSLGK